ncbi:MAG: hypothetical protein KAT66_10320 [Candidatus Lokiarchaeota archaeon]|nr:hypothetical protein [Candidatus Lokiarchaeota archaeon]
MTLERIKGELSSYYVGALICSVITGILFLATDFAGWYNYSPRIYGWVGSYALYEGGAIGGLAFVFIGLAFLGIAALSFIALRHPEKIPSIKILQGSMVFSAVIAILSIIGAIVFEVEMADADYTDWWLGEAFYGGLIGGLLTAALLYLAIKGFETKK